MIRSVSVAMMCAVLAAGTLACSGGVEPSGLADEADAADDGGGMEVEGALATVQAPPSDVVVTDMRLVRGQVVCVDPGLQFSTGTVEVTIGVPIECTFSGCMGTGAPLLASASVDAQGYFNLAFLQPASAQEPLVLSADSYDFPCGNGYNFNAVLLEDNAMDMLITISPFFI